MYELRVRLRQSLFPSATKYIEGENIKPHCMRVLGGDTFRYDDVYFSGRCMQNYIFNVRAETDTEERERSAQL